MTESDAEGEDTPLKQEMTQMRNELLTALREGLGQLREEVNAKTAIGGSVGRLDTEVDEPQATQSRPQSCQDKLIATQERLESAERKLALVDDTISSADALSITVRNQGTAGGSRYDYKGAAANRLCLTMEPEFDGTSLPDKYTYLQGAEYEDIEGHLNHDVPCSVCRAPQSTTIMVPATLTCSPGWVSQYTGLILQLGPEESRDAAGRRDPLISATTSLRRVPTLPLSSRWLAKHALAFEAGHTGRV
nr:hypothetical protein BaRGS_006646 [Batillaria attramentaria]